MTLRTITFDPAEWQVVPKKLTENMRTELFEAPHRYSEQSAWEGILDAAPEPPAQQPMTVEQIVQSLRESILNLKACPESPATLGAISALEFQMGKIFHGIGKGESDAD